MRLLLVGLAAGLAACAGETIDTRGLDARYPRLRALAPHPLGESRPYALAFDGELVLFLCRWPADAPIPVSIGEEAAAKEVDALAAALRGWEGAGLGVRFVRVAARGAIRVRVRDDIVTSQADTVADCAVGAPPAPGAGEVPGARLVGASIHVARDDPNTRLTLLHEIGHALGFQGHVPRGSTLMLSRHAAVVARAGEVTESSPVEDVALRALYAVPSGAIVARIRVSREQTLPADRLRSVAAQQGYAGPFARMGDREGLLWWADGVGRRLALRIEGAARALRDPGALRLSPASAEARRVLGGGPPRSLPAG